MTAISAVPAATSQASTSESGVSPPAGAVPPAEDDWQHPGDGSPAYRYVWSEQFDAATEVRAVVCQYDDGRIGAEGDDAPLVYVGPDECSPADARALAAAIVRAADLAETWAGVAR